MRDLWRESDAGKLQTSIKEIYRGIDDLDTAIRGRQVKSNGYTSMFRMGPSRIIKQIFDKITDEDCQDIYLFKERLSAMKVFPKM